MKMIDILIPERAVRIFKRRLGQFDITKAPDLDNQIKILKYHLKPGFYNLVLRYTLASESTKQQFELVGAAHTQQNNKLAFKALTCLYSQGFDKGQFLVTRPFFYLKDVNTIFYQYQPGFNLKEWFLQAKKVDQELIKLAAQYLAKLHDLPVNKRLRLGVGDLQHRQFYLDKSLEKSSVGHQAKIKKLYQQLAEQESKLKYRATYTHHDFHLENIIVDPKKNIKQSVLSAIDWSSFGVGDPAADLGGFSQQFVFMLQGQAGLRITKVGLENRLKLFRAEYIKSRQLEVADNFEKRVFLHQAATCLKSISYFIYKKQEQATVKRLLLECQQYLNLAV